MKTILSLTAASLLGLSLNASGATVSILVPNHSFEQDVISDTGISTGAAGWIGAATAYTSNPGANFYPGAAGAGVPAGGDGPQCALLADPVSFQSSTPLAAAVAGVTYTLTVSIGDAITPVEVRRTSHIGFLLNDTFTSSSSISFGAADYGPEGAFTDFTFEYTALPADAGKGLKIFLGQTTVGIIHYDNVRLSATAVPEPSAALLGLGAAAGLMLRRKRRCAD